MIHTAKPGRIRIAAKLERRLASAEFRGPVTTALGDFGIWVGSSRPYFFPEYTDHGPDHINGVLGTAEALCAPAAWKVFTPSDACALVLAVLLHDCAMHLTADGFVSLIREGLQPVQGFEDKPWGLLWQDYVAEANRFSGKQLHALFGRPDPVPAPSLDTLTWSDHQRILIGEFLRRHHHRLAHEIALGGVPGPEKERIRLTLPPSLADLAGLIARSHGLPIRHCLAHLSNRFHLREYQGIHAVFLMALLRISDYLQIQASRAPKEIRLVQRIRSPVSQREWDAHASVLNITRTDDDPETISVQAAPPDIRCYLRLKELIEGAQRELDASWAVLGEVYGRFKNEGMNRLSLSIRRVRSNLDDPTLLAALPYLPQKTSFSAAAAELLNLLVGPLYGHKPEIGIRELLQNSLDAVRELRQLQRECPELDRIETQEQDSDVLISVESDARGSKWVSVSDRGIGMTAEIVRKYLLTAGASFRNSDVWKNRFEDEKGAPKIVRAGRFGIGSLAAFLLGDTIRVSTRHAETLYGSGLDFTAKLSDEVVELRKNQRPVGTTVQVKIDDATFERLVGSPSLWDFYTGRWPTVKRVAKSAKGRIKQRYLTPSQRRMAGWHRVSHPDYSAIYWTYSEAPELVCNQIIIGNTRRSFPEDWELWAWHRQGVFDSGLGWGLETPSIAVVDPLACLPLNLQRSGLKVDKLPFQKELTDSVLEDFVRSMPDRVPPGPVWEHPFHNEYAKPMYGGLAFNAHGSFLPWVSCRDGWVVFDRSLLEALDFESVLVTCGYDWPGRLPVKLAKEPTHHAVTSYRFVGKEFIAADDKDDRYDGLRALIDDGDEVRALTNGSLGVEEWGFTLPDVDFEQVWQDYPWALFETPGCTRRGFDFREFAQLCSPAAGQRWQTTCAHAWIGEVFFGPKKRKPSKLASVWLRIVGRRLLPYRRRATAAP